MVLPVFKVKEFESDNITAVETGVIFLDTVKVPLIVLVPVPVKLKLANEPALIVELAAPLNLTVLVNPGLKVPLLIQSPVTSKRPAPEIVKVAPACMVRLLAFALATPVIG
jgi:hypothetical protein